MTFDNAYFSIGYMDRLSHKDTFVHRLDPRSKVAATIVFLFTVVSYPKYEVAMLLPFFLFPVLLMTLGDIPMGFVLKRLIVVSPFAVMIGALNPLLDQKTAAHIFGLPLSAGWLSFIAIVVKFALTVSAALLLIATTSFYGVCNALRWLGLPALFVSQLLFLYRYMFVLMEEAMRIVRAHDMRAFGAYGRGIRVFVRIMGTLFVRTIERAERIYRAMLSRGFSGEAPLMKRRGFTAADGIFVLASLLYFAAFRFFPVPEAVGRYVLGLVR